jgi:hypothetical protein
VCVCVCNNVKAIGNMLSVEICELWSLFSFVVIVFSFFVIVKNNNQIL